jgi:hypothetical protein
MTQLKLRQKDKQFVKNTPLQLTLREMTQQITPRFLAGLLGVVCILTVSAPFNTAELFNTVPLFFYWGAIATSTYFTATFLVIYTGRKLESNGVSKLKTRVIASVVAAVFVALLVCFINIMIVGVHEFYWLSVTLLAVKCMLISFAVTTIFYMVADGKKQTVTDSPSDTTEKAISPFFQRLSPSLGTDIISLQAQDHYVEVTTIFGRELVLIRLSDAIQELGMENGIQTHRSWWVMGNHVIEQKRFNGKACLLLSNGAEVPVSRTYAIAVKRALKQ